MAEAAEKSREDKRYGSEKKPEPREESRREPERKESEAKPEGGGDDHASDMKAMMGRHEKEHRDLHGTHRDAMRKMMERHATEMAAMHSKMAEMPPAAEPDAGAGVAAPMGGAGEEG